MNVPGWITRIIEDIQAPTMGIPTRYPYTYAYDFLRSHADMFEIDASWDVCSRSSMALWLHEQLGTKDDSDPLHRAVCEALANAYLIEHRQVLS